MGCRTSFVAELVIGMDVSRQLDKKIGPGRRTEKLGILKFGHKFFTKSLCVLGLGKSFFTFEKLKFWNLFMSWVLPHCESPTTTMESSESLFGDILSRSQDNNTFHYNSLKLLMISFDVIVKV